VRQEALAPATRRLMRAMRVVENFMVASVAGLYKYGSE
jgi:hypothetical protein